MCANPDEPTIYSNRQNTVVGKPILLSEGYELIPGSIHYGNTLGECAETDLIVADCY